MPLQGKISTVAWSNTHAAATGITEYHRVTFEGDATVYNIGAKAKMPPFLAVGSVLWYDLKNDGKNGIKRATPPLVPVVADSGVSTQTVSAPQVSSDDRLVEFAIEQAVQLAVITNKTTEIPALAKRILDLHRELKESLK